jgi:hypothetical protein
MPKRSKSYLGVSNATTSISHPLHAPLLKWSNQGDFVLAHFNKPRSGVFSSLPEAVGLQVKLYPNKLARLRG